MLLMLGDRRICILAGRRPRARPLLPLLPPWTRRASGAAAAGGVAQTGHASPAAWGRGAPPAGSGIAARGGEQNRQPSREGEEGKKTILIAPRPWHPRGVLDSPCSGSWARPTPRPDQETPRWLVRFLARFLVLPPADRDEGWIAREEWECEWAGGGV